MEGQVPGTLTQEPGKGPKSKFVVMEAVLSADNKPVPGLWHETEAQPPESIRHLNNVLIWMMCHPDLSGRYRIMVDLGNADVIV